MQQPGLSLAGKLDTGLTKGLCLLFGWLINTAIWLLGLSMLSSQYFLVFEYGEGLADVSWHEWGFMLLTVLLLWRHIRYCRHFVLGFWCGLSRLLSFQGRLACVLLTIFGFAIGYEQDVAVQRELLNSVLDPVSELTAFGLVLLALYLAAPTASASLVVSNPATTLRIEPTLNIAEKDATA